MMSSDLAFQQLVTTANRVAFEFNGSRDTCIVWIHCYDQLPRAVRQRLAASPFNICPACMDEMLGGQRSSVAKQNPPRHLFHRDCAD
jgi:hypothetical protein